MVYEAKIDLKSMTIEELIRQHTILWFQAATQHSSNPYVTNPLAKMSREYAERFSKELIEELEHRIGAAHAGIAE